MVEFRSQGTESDSGSALSRVVFEGLLNSPPLPRPEEANFHFWLHPRQFVKESSFLLQIQQLLLVDYSRL